MNSYDFYFLFRIVFHHLNLIPHQLESLQTQKKGQQNIYIKKNSSLPALLLLLVNLATRTNHPKLDLKWNYPISIKGGFTLANAKLQCLDASRVREVEEIRWTDLEGATIREQRWRWRLRGTKREMEMKIESVAERDGDAYWKGNDWDGDWECSGWDDKFCIFVRFD